MLQLSITLLFALAGGMSVIVIGQALRRAAGAIAPLRQAIAACEDLQDVAVRTRSLEQRVRPALRVIERPVIGAKKVRPLRMPYGLPAAA